MEEELFLNDNYELMIKTKKNNTYNAKSIFEKVKIPFLISEDVTIKERNDKEIKFEFEETDITFYNFPTDCFLEDENINTIIYSTENLKLIIQKLKKKYADPILYSTEKNQKIINFETTEIDLEQKLIIKNNISLDEKIKQKYKELNDLFNMYKQNKSNSAFKLKTISSNLKNYLTSLKNENLEEPFYYLISKERRLLEYKINEFIKKKDESIYPIVGPYGIGKSLTALIIQKNLYIQGIKSLYINVKYYFQGIPFINKLETLINEWFYLCSSQEDFFSYHSLLDNKNYNNIWQYLKDIYDNIKNYENYLFIIDQYKKSYDTSNEIFSFPNIHIFLLSSINDKDIKSDILCQLRNENPRLKYQYLIKLIENNNLLVTINESSLNSKIPDGINNLNDLNNNNDKIIKYNDNKNKLINNILAQFGFLPRYISLLLDKYDNIYDFSNEEYIKIFRGYKKFFKNFNISNFNNLSKEYNISGNPKPMYLTTFIDNLNDIPLKYVNYEINNKNYYLKYAFPLSKTIFESFYIYDSDETKFISDEEDGFNIFEKYLRITLRCFGKLQIDGYFEVNTILDLNLTDYYKGLNNSYFLNKSNILISQKIRNGKDFDICIYKPNIKSLILIQIKYCIKSNNVSLFSYYKKIYKNFNVKFEEKFKTPIDKVYLLYFSSYHYNESRKREVLNILNKNKINCLFFNISNSDISFDFKHNIDDIQLTDSFILFPSQQNYKPQWKEEEVTINNISNLLNKKRYIDNKINDYKECKIKKYSIEDNYYQQFLNYFKNKEISDNILKHLDKFIQIYINSYGKTESLPQEDLYLLIFELINGNIDFNEKLGLIYINDYEEVIFFDIKESKKLKENDFCKKYYNCCYAVGKYKRN